MKTKTILLLTIVLQQLLIAQTPVWQWANRFGNGSYVISKNICADPFGNVIIEGNYNSRNLVIGNQTVTNVSSTFNPSQLFLAKYDANGNFLWATHAGKDTFDISGDICSDLNGNIFVTGGFNGSNLVLGTTTLTGLQYNYNFFLSKYNASGSLVWAQTILGANAGNAVVTDASGNIFVAGYFRGNSVSFGTTTLSSNGNAYDIFIAKYDPSGNVVWAKSAGGSGYDYPTSMCITNNGDLILTGSIRSTIALFGNVSLTNAGGGDIFIAKYNSSGNILWAKGAGGSGDDYGKSICVDHQGNMFVSGYFNSSNAVFNGINVTQLPGGDNDFIAKYDSNGNSIWVKNFQTNNIYHRENRVCKDAFGFIYFTTSYSGTASISNTTIVSAGSDDILIAKFDQSGNLNWLKSTGGTSNQIPYDICSGTADNLFLTGSLNDPTVNFDNISLPSSSTSFTSDAFVAKITGYFVGMNEITQEKNGVLFPNPFNGECKLLFGKNVNKAKILVYNNIGQLMFSEENITGAEYTFKQKNLIPGLYYIKLIQANDLILEEKIIIKPNE